MKFEMTALSEVPPVVAIAAACDPIHGVPRSVLKWQHLPEAVVRLSSCFQKPH